MTRAGAGNAGSSRSLTVLVSGDRNWTDRGLILQVLEEYPGGTRLIHGDQRGADRTAGEIGLALGFEVIPVPAEWSLLGRRAGPIRNARMVREYGPVDIVEAFHNDLANSKGTADLIKQAHARRIPVHLHMRIDGVHLSVYSPADEEAP